MKKGLLLLLSFYFSVAVIAQRNIDVLHYTFRIELNDLDDTLYGEAAIQFVYTQNAATIEIDLENINTAMKGMKVMAVQYPDGWPGEIVIKETSFSHRQNKIVIPRGEKAVKGDTGFLSLPIKVFRLTASSFQKPIWQKNLLCRQLAQQGSSLAALQ
ncbi:MAG: hypothetical protein IPQ25_06155 [Chitinophagaceae bacterium]|nr:hypothetical protein [Chitinophagaceae bacterium]